MTLSFQIAPYFDDFSAEKNFYKILFQPSRPVQTRELNQLQSIVQDQITKFGSAIFQNGTVVIPGNVFYDPKVNYVKLSVVYAGVNVDSYLSSLVGSTLAEYNGSTATGVEAIVIAAVTSVDNDPPTLIVRYIAGSGQFSPNSAGYILQQQNGTLVFTVGNFADPVGPSSICTINDGIYYVNGVFVTVSKQILVLDKYDNTPSVVVGLTVNENIVTASADDSLYDNALGYPNYGAPGADRYQITLTLSSFDYNTITTSTSNTIIFIKLMKINAGQITYEMNDTQYSQLERALAQRTYDECGNFVINDFSITPSNYRSNNRGLWAVSTSYLIDDLVVNSSGEYWIAVTSGTSGNVSGSMPSSAGNTVFSVNDGGVQWHYIDNPVFNNGAFLPLSTETLATMLANEQKMVYNISAGSGYIKGYKVTTNTPTLLPTSKAVTYAYQEGEVIYTTSGTWLDVTNITSLPSISTYETLNLYYCTLTEAANWSSVKQSAAISITVAGGAISSASVTSAGFGFDPNNPPAIVPPTGSGFIGRAVISLAGTIDSIIIVQQGTGYSNGTVTLNPPASPPVIGTMNVRTIEYEDGTIGNAACIYRMQVFDIALDSGYNFQSNVFSITGTTSSFKADLVQKTVQLTGTVLTYNSSPPTLGGIGTTFTTELSAGDLIQIGASGNLARVTASDFSDVLIDLSNATSGSPTAGNPIYLVQNTYATSGSLIQSLPKLFVRSIRDATDSVNSISYTVDRQIQIVTSESPATGTYILSVPGESFVSPGITGNYLVTNSVGVIQPAGTTITLTGSTQLTLQTATPGTYTVITKISKSGTAAREKKKVLTVGSLIVTNVDLLNNSIISLGQADVFRIIKILQKSGTGVATSNNYPGFSSSDYASAIDITNTYLLKSNETPYYYGVSSIEQDPAQPSPVNSIIIWYAYFAHSTGDYLDVNSYAGVSYNNMTPWVRDGLDYRPVQNADGTFSIGITEPISFGQNISLDYSYYIPRQDIITVDKNGSFYVMNGIPGYDLSAPKVSEKVMPIASTLIPPGDLNIIPAAMQISDLGNMRYTMADIGSLEKRIANLEYYTQLTLLEQQTAQSTIVDQNGVDQFKSGIQVDPFTDYGISDLTHADYACSIDIDNTLCRAMADIVQVNMQENFTEDSDRASNNYALTGSTLTMSYSNVLCISQPSANILKYVNPFQVLTYNVTALLYPNSDTWIDVSKLPTVTITQGATTAQAALAAAMAAGTFKTVWNSWNVNYTVVDTSTAASNRFSTNMTGSFNTTTPLTGPTTGTAMFQYGQPSQNTSNWLVMADQQLYQANGLINPDGSIKVGNQLGIVGNGQWGDNSSTYMFTFTAQQVGTQTYGAIAQTAGQVINEVVSQKTLNYVRTRPVFYKITQCKPNDVMDMVSFAGQQLPSDSSGNLVSALSIRISTATEGSISTLDTFFDSNAIDDSTKAAEAAYRLVSFSDLAPYTDQASSQIYWDKGSVISYGTSGFDGTKTAVVGDIVNFGGGVYELKCVNMQGTWTGGTKIYTRDGTLIGDVVSTVTVPVAANTVQIDAYGNSYGLFYPICKASMQYPSGYNQLLMQNNTDSIEVTSTASAQYYASGTSQVVQQELFLQDQLQVITKQVTGQTVQFTQEVGYHEPIAETFMIDGNIHPDGIYLTQIGLFFSEIDSKSINIQIANTLNGYPTQSIIAQTTISGSDVGSSYSDRTPTEYKVTFTDPIYLAPNVEYCVILTSPNSTLWQVWANTGAQPSSGIGVDSVGSFFESSNGSTWTADQSTDLTFNLYQAQFDISSAAEVTFVNQPLIKTLLSPNPFLGTTSSTLVRVTHPNHGFNVGDKVTITGISDSVHSSPITSGTWTILACDYDTYVINWGSTANSTGVFGSTIINNQATQPVAEYQVIFSTITPSIDIRTFDATTSGGTGDTDYTVGLVTTSFDTGTNTYEQNSSVTVLNNTTIETNKLQSILTPTNENGTKSLSMIVTMTSKNSDVSPAILVDRSYLMLVRNMVNQPTFSNTNNSVFDQQVIVPSGIWVFQYNEDDPANSSIIINKIANPTLTMGEFNAINPGNYITITANA